MRSWVATLMAIGGALAPIEASGQTDDGVYQAIMMRAAPGRFLDLIGLLTARMPVYRAAGEPRPALLRHAQGDHWDLLLLIPVASIEDHRSSDYRHRWESALRRTGFDDAEFARRMDELIAWQEDLYVHGPPIAEFQAGIATAGYFHLEIFQGLAGKRDSLLAERRMENDFLSRIGRPTNFVFRKITGAAWDLFTLGFYRDLQHYAEPSRATPDEEETAARAAGFESRAQIGPYLRRFLSSHHDTLGTIVR